MFIAVVNVYYRLVELGGGLVKLGHVVFMSRSPPTIPTPSPHQYRQLIKITV